MAIELITGRAGVPHVDSADVRAFNRTLYGDGVYVLEGAPGELVDANNVNVAAGELMCEGAHIRITGAGETLTIENGLSAYKRHDIIAAHYLRDEDGMESVGLVVIKGEADIDTPADPAMPTSGKLIEEATDVYWPLYRIVIDGLTPQTPVLIAQRQAVYTLGLGEEIPAGADLNDYTEPGVYYTVKASETANRPFGEANNGIVIVNKRTGGDSMQTYVVYNGISYSRLWQSSSNNWRDWTCNSGVDSVVSSGTSGVWKYHNFASGLKLAYATAAVREVASTTKTTNGLYKGTFVLPSDPGFKKVEAKIAIIINSSSKVPYSAVLDANTMHFYTDTSVASQNITVGLMYSGTWK